MSASCGLARLRDRRRAGSALVRRAPPPRTSARLVRAGCSTAAATESDTTSNYSPASVRGLPGGALAPTDRGCKFVSLSARRATRGGHPPAPIFWLGGSLFQRCHSIALGAKRTRQTNSTTTQTPTRIARRRANTTCPSAHKPERACLRLETRATDLRDDHANRIKTELTNARLLPNRL